MEEAVIVDASNQSGKLHDVAPHKHTTRLERHSFMCELHPVPPTFSMTKASEGDDHLPAFA